MARALHIAIDGRELLGQPTGVGRYLLSILREWLADDAWPHRITVVVPSAPSSGLASLSPRVTWHVAPSVTSGTWWEQTSLRSALAKITPGVFFAAGYTAPVSVPCPYVVAIYDVSFFARPDGFRWRERLRRQWLTRNAARRARRVVTISEFSATEITRWLGVSRATIRIAPPGAPVPTEPSQTSPRLPVVLFVGSLFGRRHVPELMKGFAAAQRTIPAARLVLVGSNRTTPRIDPLELAHRYGIAAAMEWHPYLSDHDLEALYRRARVFTFLSDYEGFGMTPMEAIGHGVPPLLLDTPISREVYGDGATFVDLSPAGIASALVTLLRDEGAHADLLRRGQSRLAHYSWARSATAIRHALEEAAERP